jgi:hypothetical protein
MKTTNPTIPPHLNWLFKSSEQLQTADGKNIQVFEFLHKKDDKILSGWAKHFRNQYCADSEIDSLVSGTGKTKNEYLLSIVFPDEKQAPGPSIRSGDFAEILVSDYLEYLMNYWVPRTRYDNKTIRNESTKGSDILGFVIRKTGVVSSDDEMIIFEVKAKLTGKAETNRLQDAINDSAKDEVRQAESLNAIKRRFIIEKQETSAKMIERFQNKVDYPYIEKSGAAAILEKNVFSETNFTAASTLNHPNKNNLFLIVIKGEQMMPLVHELYQRAAHEA